jgi:hypothetical protein
MEKDPLGELEVALMDRTTANRQRKLIELNKTTNCCPTFPFGS